MKKFFLSKQKITEKHVAKIRHDWGLSDAKRDETKKTPENIQRFDNILYGEDKTWQILDVYKPKSAEGKLPVIVNVHGGGWVYGTKEVYQFYCMSLAQMGFAVVNFNYRLAPENKFPSSVEDTNSVFNWIEKNKTEYGFDCKNVFAVGDSAGANLLALYAAIFTNAELKKKYNFELPSEINLKAVALNCGKYTVRNFDILMTSLFDKKSKYNVDDIEITSKITPDFPPSILMTCKGDFLCKEIYPIMKALEKQTVPFQCNFYGTKEKPLWHVFHVDCDMKEAQECNKTQMEFFKSFLQKD